MKNKAASQLGKLSWAKLSPEEQKARASRGGQGFKRKWAKMTEEEKKAHMERVWSKRPKVLKKEDL